MGQVHVALERGIMSDCGRCRDCKHYGDYGRDGAECLRIGNDPPNMVAWSLGAFNVTSDFGCVQFEKREDSNEPS